MIQKVFAEWSERIRAIGFLCALMVVPIHAFSPSVWFCENSSLSALEAGIAFIFTDTISRCAVPCFFVISGFFLALKYEPTWVWYRTTLRKRFMSLYIPFVIWNVFYLIRNSLVEHTNLFSLDRVFGYNLLTGPGFGLFWYVQVILLVVIIAPLWLTLLRCRWSAVVLLLVFFAGWATGNFGHYYSLQLSYGNFLWLSIGAVVGLGHFTHHNFFHVRLRMMALIILTGAVVLHVYSCVQRDTALMNLSDRITIATGVYTLFANATWVCRLLRPLSSVFCLSFFIYAMHPQGLIVHIPLDAIHTPFLIVYFVRIICGMVIPILLGLFLIRFAPRIMMLLTGGRVGR